MSVKEGMLKEISDFSNSGEIDDDWLLRHMAVNCDDGCKTVTIVIDNINEQKYKWVKEEM